MNSRRGVTRDLMAAVYPLLNVSTFLAVAGALYHGQAPQETPLPYGVLQAPAGYLALPAMQSAAEEVRFQLKAVSGSADYDEALRMIDLAKQLLDGERPTIANHLVIKLAWEWTQVYPDPELVNGVPVFNAVSQWCALVDQVA